MKNSNIIISVIIVLCIATGVTAYSTTNPEGEISNLLGYTPADSDDADDGSTGSDGVNNRTSSNSSGSSSRGSGSNANKGSSSSNNQGSPSSGGSGNSNHGGMSASEAKSIAQNAIGEPGAYAGTPYWDSSSHMWIVKVYDKSGNVIDGIGVEPNGHTNREQ